ncbi:hypothetical protein SAMN02745216_02065 [Desulfatibacillum alkenivorans DSM 16219]|jgi:hypothetical protein|uniref:Uncharacterized protein n=1 Tax=Desulfatibacillum alkenivorans DSM 16219 TaxID=1121393 RepID=A0A1M6L8U7_9BACT|nr:hypothetical protein [Desulfatibacillum alkenivorans]SHJ67583.1 hypothetical protein SAMN02745216_02065 [Desulfatibacillum alkenivorans DSM 16219]
MPAMDMIDRSLFYSDESEKTKLNWLCYELAMAFYDDLVKPLKKSRHKVHKLRTAVFSVYAALELKDAICRYADGDAKSLEIHEAILDNHLPPLGPKTKRKVLKIMKMAWNEHFALCRQCPTNCLQDRDARCYLFEGLE